MQSQLTSKFCLDKSIPTVVTSTDNSTRVCQKCIFPFKFDNETFYNCTDYGFTNIWCSVKVDKEAVQQEGFWQDCSICDCSCIQVPTSSGNQTFMTTSMNGKNGKHKQFFIESNLQQQEFLSR